MSYQPVNGAPMTITLGTDDRSTKKKVFEAAPVAIHTPLFYLWSQWGPTEQQLIYGGSRELVYGGDTFDTRSKWANHATLYINRAAENANPMMLKRLKPEDAPAPANFRLSVDVLTDENAKLYDRESDGSFKKQLDSGEPAQKDSETVKAFTLKFVVEYIEPDQHSKESKVGKGSVVTGDQVGTNGTSQRYPLFDFETPFFGSKGNSFGVRIWAPTIKDAYPMNSNIFEQDSVYPYRLSFVEKVSRTTSAKVIPSNYGELFTEFTLKPGMIDTANGKERYIGDTVIQNYQNMNPTEGMPKKYGPFGRLHTYQENIEAVLKLIYEEEKKQDYLQNELRDAGEEGFWKVNLFGGQSSRAVPYQTVRFAAPTTGAVRLTENTSMFAQGGGDGTMNDEVFAKMVASEIAEYANTDSPVQDILGNPANFFWDSGFPMETKYELGKFISKRKDTYVVLSTHVDGEAQLTASEESARTITLVNRIRAYADSDYFGTPAFRFVVASRSGKKLNGFYKGFVSTSYQVLEWMSKMANTSKFKSEYVFDTVPNNIVTLLGDINAPWVPATVRNRDWENGMLWVERLTNQTYYVPAARSGYKDDTSILTSMITGVAIARCHYVGQLAQKRFSGGRRTKAELKQEVEDFIRSELRNAFAERLVIIPEVYFDEADEANGFSWHTKIKVYDANMRTVQILSVESHRLDDLPNQHNGFVS